MNTSLQETVPNVDRYLCSHLSESVNCYSLVVSMYGYTGRHGEEVIPYTEEACILFTRTITERDWHTNCGTG